MDIAASMTDDRISYLENGRILFRVYEDDPQIFHHLTEPLNETAAAEFIDLPLELFRTWSELNGGPQTIVEQDDGPTYCRVELLSWASAMLCSAQAKVNSN